ncbi:MAG: TolC family protein [Bacteroidales bacterium]|nr:TolC family protein [Bacteroidales bacterium]
MKLHQLLRYIMPGFLLLILLMTFVPAQAQKEKTFTLKDCIHYALENRASVKNQRLSEELSKKNRQEVNSQWFPQISGGAKYQYTIRRQVLIIGDNTIFVGLPQQLQAYVNVNQTLFDPVLMGNSSGARINEKLSVENTRLSEIDLVVQVKKAFYGVLVFREQLKLLDANITRTEKSLKDTEYQYKNGLAQKVDIDRIKVLVNNAVTNKANALRNLNTMMQSLKYYLGMKVSDPLQIKGTISDSLLAGPVTLPDQHFYEQREEFKKAQLNLEMNRLLQNNVAKSSLPTLSAFYSLTAPFNGSTFNGMFDRKLYPSSYVGLQLSVPVFSGLKRHYQYQQAKISVQQSENSLNDLKNSIELEYNQYFRQYENDLANLKTQSENIKLAELNYKNLKYQYDNGVQPLIEVLNAETTLLQAQDNYISALYQALVNKVDLDKSLGKIKY